MNYPKFATLQHIKFVVNWNKFFVYNIKINIYEIIDNSF